jgi:pimeloyl-ACP methyl ester carboxylesterase
VLVHGFGVSSTYFVPAARLLSKEFAVYAPDLPGHGRSTTPARALDLHELADSLLVWMDAIGLKRAALIGNSMGCQVIVEATLKEPDRVDRLVLIGPVVDPSANTRTELIKRALRDSVHERLSLGLIVLANYTRMGLRLLSELRHMLRYNLEEGISKIGVPTLLVRGAEDPVASQEWIDKLAGLLSEPSVMVIPDAGHVVHYSAPDELVRSILPFLREGKPRTEGDRPKSAMSRFAV